MLSQRIFSLALVRRIIGSITLVFLQETRKPLVALKPLAGVEPAFSSATCLRFRRANRYRGM